MRLDTIIARLTNPTIAVIGDLMLDAYRIGQVYNMSHEAPVPILRLTETQYRLGGAASVAGMLRALGATPLLVGVIGDDEHGYQLKLQLAAQDISMEYVQTCPGRPTTYKERLVGRTHGTNQQQLLRVDHECKTLVSYPDIIRATRAALDRTNMVLVSDYAKGVCSFELLRELVRWDDTAGTLPNKDNEARFIIADPARAAPWMKYAGANCLTPNRLELAAILGKTAPCTSISAARELVAELCEYLPGTRIVAKLDCDGLLLSRPDGPPQHLRAQAREVSDPTGAGDMVLAMLGLALASGIDYHHAALLANHAGGMMVQHFGAAPISRSELTRSLYPDKVYQLADLLDVVQRLRQAGRQIVLANGCFDILHPGHLQLLREASRQGDFLIVAINTDESVRVLKGPRRPTLELEARCQVLSILPYVDAIISFAEPTPLALVQALRPDCIVKGSDYEQDQVVGGTEVAGWGGRVHIVPLLAGYSTSRILEDSRA